MESEKKSVLHLIHSGGFYGAEAVVLNLCIGLQKSKFRPVLGCFMSSGQEKPQLGLLAETKGIKVEYFNFGRKFDFQVIKNLYQVIISEKIGLIHSHGYKPSFYCLMIFLFYRIPYIVTCHLWFCSNIKMYFNVLAERISMLFAKKIVAVSYPIAKEIASWRLLKKKITVINNGIDIDKYTDYREDFDRDQLRKGLGLKNDSILIGTLGRLTPQKGHEYLLEAAAKILRERQNIEFIVAGDGPLKDILVQKARDLNILDAFHFVGFRSDAINILRLLDIFVFSSIDEGLPIALLEAMAVGLPIIATDVGDISQVIQNRFNGILVRSKCPNELAESISALLNDTALRKKLAVCAMNTVNRDFNTSRMSEKYVKIYDELNTEPEVFR